MSPFTSPLTSMTGVKCVFVRNSADWVRFGQWEWTYMATLLAGQEGPYRLMGLDTEWVYTSPLSTVQIATATHCFVIHLAYMDGRELPASVKAVLVDDTVIKCGVGVNGDVARLEKEQSITLRCCLDVGSFSVLLDMSESGATSLATLVELTVGVTLRKDKKITRSNWEKILNRQQVAYAADDAMASFLIGCAVLQMAVSRADTVRAINDAGSVQAWVDQWSVHASAASRYLLAVHAARANLQKHAKSRTDAAAAACSSSPSSMQELQSPPQEHQEQQEQQIPQQQQQRGPLHMVHVYPAPMLDVAPVMLPDCTADRAFMYVHHLHIATGTPLSPDDPTTFASIAVDAPPLPRDGVGKGRTRKCFHARAGLCQLGSHCPYSHTESEYLAPDTLDLLVNPTRPSCGFCLGVMNVAWWPVVPSHFCVYLPVPFDRPAAHCDGGYVPVCAQCRELLHHYIQHQVVETNHVSEDAFSGAKREIAVLSSLKRAAGALKQADADVEKAPAHRQFILDHWRVASYTHPSAATAVAKAASFHDCSADEIFVRTPLLSIPGPAAAHYHCIPVKNVDGSLNPELPAALLKVGQEDVRGRVVMGALVGDNVAKAEAFLAEWRQLLEEVCGLVRKPSNRITEAQIEQMHTAKTRQDGATEQASSASGGNDESGQSSGVTPLDQTMDRSSA